MGRITKMSAAEIESWIERLLRMKASTWVRGTDMQAIADEVPRSDVVAADFIKDAFSGSINYIPAEKAWYVWNGIYHEKFEGEQIPYWLAVYFAKVHKDAMRKVSDRYVALAETKSDDKEKAKVMAEYQKGLFGDHRKYRDRAHNDPGIKALINQITFGFSAENNYFSDDRKYLVFLNGVLDLEDLIANPPSMGDLWDVHDRLQEHDSSRAVYRCIEAEFNPAADSSRWMGFLEKSLPDAASRKFFATLVGQALLGRSKTKFIPVLYGRKDSGKSVFVDTICHLLGGYAVQPDVKVLNKSDSQNFEQDLLCGMRLVSVVEPDTDKKLDEPFIKRFTGGDALSTRTLNGKPRSWISQGIFMIATNSELKFNTSDRSILDRICMVTFPNKFYPLGQVPEGLEDYVFDLMLESDLAENLEGILVWVVNGMLASLAEGIVLPEGVQQFRETSYEESNSVVRWYVAVSNGEVEKMSIEPGLASGSCVPLAIAWEAYQKWCYAGGENPKNKFMFSKALRAHTGEQLVSNNGSKRVKDMALQEAF